jgi:hypothetical protein
VNAPDVFAVDIATGDICVRVPTTFRGRKCKGAALNPCLSLDYIKEDDDKIVDKMDVLEGGLIQSRGAMSLVLVPLLLAEGEFLESRQVTWWCGHLGSQTATSQTLIPNKARLVVAKRQRARSRWPMDRSASLSRQPFTAGAWNRKLRWWAGCPYSSSRGDRLRVIAPEPAPGPS